jgi:hypothetical protein
MTQQHTHEELGGTPELDERAIDQVLADSFPASDPPPWTLGVRRDRRAAAETQPRPGRQEPRRGEREP